MTVDKIRERHTNTTMLFPYEAEILFAEIDRLKAELAKGEDVRCLVVVKGERCCLPAGHPGGHKWGNGD